MILSWSLRHDILFLSHVCLHISTAASFPSLHLGKFVEKGGLALIVVELELEGCFLLPYMGLAKIHIRVGMGPDTDMGKLFLTVRSGREIYH